MRSRIQPSLQPLSPLLVVGLCLNWPAWAWSQAAATSATTGAGLGAVTTVFSFDASDNEDLAHPQTITVFDAPGAGTGPGQGTLGIAIHPAGAIAGAYIDDHYVAHGFVRAPSGALTTFDAPGAGTGRGAPGCVASNSCPGTVAWSINPAGVIAGEYSDASSVSHGFVRFRDGAIIVFDALGAGTGPGQGTYVSTVSGITPAGEITGFYADESSVEHGYVRTPDGAITTFDAPDAGTGASQGTYGCSINPKGQVTCFYVDASGLYHGYLRAPDGTITSFDAPGAGTSSGEGTSPANINPAGEIVGNYVDSSGVNHGLLRAPHGTITSFDAPGAGTGSGQGTFPASNNPAGAITGYQIDATGVFHGFLRNPQGWGSSR